MRYTWPLSIAITAFVNSLAFAQSWQFEAPIDVSSTSAATVFHHLESSGRRSIATSENDIAITWEDDRDGNPTVYLAKKSLNAEKFNPDIKISGSGEAYEPAIAVINNDSFVISWEEDEQVYARLISHNKVGPMMRLGDEKASQASVAVNDKLVIVTVSERSQRFARIKQYQLEINDLQLSLADSCFVDPEPVKNEQLYPVVSVTDKHTVIVWEDRRPGHTIIMASQNKPGENCSFDLPVRISQRPPGPKAPFGTGHGVARAAMTLYGTNNLFAMWADKRNFREGYDIYGSDRPAGKSFQDNIKIQDDFGGDSRQFHSSLAGHPNGQLVAAWTDERESTPDIFISWLEDGNWSDDIDVNGASGTGEQVHPSIILDKQGNLHLAWIEKPSTGAATRLRYVKGLVAND